MAKKNENKFLHLFVVRLAGANSFLLKSFRISFECWSTWRAPSSYAVTFLFSCSTWRLKMNYDCDRFLLYKVNLHNFVSSDGSCASTAASKAIVTPETIRLRFCSCSTQAQPDQRLRRPQIETRLERQTSLHGNLARSQKMLNFQINAVSTLIFLSETHSIDGKGDKWKFTAKMNFPIAVKTRIDQIVGLTFPTAESNDLRKIIILSMSDLKLQSLFETFHESSL